MLSTLPGWAIDLFSEASAAAVTCAIIKPELTPALSTKNGGRPPDKVASISKATRRSDIEPISAIAKAKISAAKATGSAWKLPPDMATGPSSLLKISGLSVTALDSMSSVFPAWLMISRQAPMTCGWQRKQ